MSLGIPCGNKDFTADIYQLEELACWSLLVLRVGNFINLASIFVTKSVRNNLLLLSQQPPWLTVYLLPLELPQQDLEIEIFSVIPVVC